MRILLIDDDAAYCAEFATRLAECGVTYSRFDTAATAEDGERHLNAGMHDICFMDFRLPGEDGLILTRNARKAGMTIPIIVLTSFGSPAIDEAAAAAGATDFLVKGEFSAELLGRAIRYATQNAAAIAAARDAEMRFRLAQEVANIGTWDWDVRANTKYWSPGMRRLYGLDPEVTTPVSYDTWASRVHPDDRDRVQAVLAAAVMGEAAYDTTFRILRGDGARPEVRWVAGKAESLRGASGAVVRMVGVNIDITDQQDARRGLEAARAAALGGQEDSEGRFRTLFDNTVEGLFHVVRNGRRIPL